MLPFGDKTIHTVKEYFKLEEPLSVSRSRGGVIMTYHIPGNIHRKSHMFLGQSCRHKVVASACGWHGIAHLLARDEELRVRVSSRLCGLEVNQERRTQVTLGAVVIWMWQSWCQVRLSFIE